MSKSNPRKRPRPSWHILPPLLYGGETLEAAPVLDEIPSALGLLLWRSIRHVRLWATVEPRERTSLFSGTPPAPALPPEAGALSDDEQIALGRLASLPYQRVWPKHHTDTLAEDTRRLTAWALQAGHPRTALELALTRAVLTPSLAEAAEQVALIADSLADARAEVWHRRTISLARRRREWDRYARGFLALRSIALQRHDDDRAEYYLTRAIRGARRGGYAKLLRDLTDEFGAERIQRAHRPRSEPTA